MAFHRFGVLLCTGSHMCMSAHGRQGKSKQKEEFRSCDVNGVCLRHCKRIKLMFTWRRHLCKKIHNHCSLIYTCTGSHQLCCGTVLGHGSHGKGQHTRWCPSSWVRHGWNRSCTRTQTIQRYCCRRMTVSDIRAVLYYIRQRLKYPKERHKHRLHVLIATDRRPGSTGKTEKHSNINNESACPSFCLSALLCKCDANCTNPCLA